VKEVAFVSKVGESALASIVWLLLGVSVERVMEGCWWYVSGCVDIGVGVGGEVGWEKKVVVGVNQDCVLVVVMSVDMGEQSRSHDVDTERRGERRREKWWWW
jgi:hypothetical protein